MEKNLRKSKNCSLPGPDFPLLLPLTTFLTALTSVMVSSGCRSSPNYRLPTPCWGPAQPPKPALPTTPCQGAAPAHPCLMGPST